MAQAKYDSFILEIITIASATSLLSRVVLGYWRLAQRYNSQALHYVHAMMKEIHHELHWLKADPKGSAACACV